jgi:hypothetical protein
MSEKAKKKFVTDNLLHQHKTKTKIFYNLILKKNTLLGLFRKHALYVKFCLFLFISI